MDSPRPSARRVTGKVTESHEVTGGNNGKHPYFHDPYGVTAMAFSPRIHPVNLSLGHGSSIQEVSGRGSRSAASTVSHPWDNGIVLSLPLRATQRKTPQDSQTVARSSVVFASCATYRSTSSRLPSAHSTGASAPLIPSSFPAMPMPLAAASRPTPYPSLQRTWNIMSTWASARTRHSARRRDSSARTSKSNPTPFQVTRV